MYGLLYGIGRCQFLGNRGSRKIDDAHVNSAREGLDKPMIAAVANAIHDATGVRLRRPPFRKARGLAALRAAAAQTEVQAHRQADAFHSYAARL